MSISDKSAVVVAESRNATRKMLAEFWFYFSQNRGAVAGLVVFIALVIVALAAPLVAPHDPDVQYRDFFLTPPVWQEGGNVMFLLGTDAVGRDMLSRLIFGARFSLFIGLVVVGIALTGGIVIGVIAGVGATTLRATGDLQIAAPHGKIDLRSKNGVEVRTSKLRFVADSWDAVLGVVRQRCKELLNQVTGVARFRSKRRETTVQDTDRVRAGRIVSKAQRDVQIDGEKIHLG